MSRSLWKPSYFSWEFLKSNYDLTNKEDSSAVVSFYNRTMLIQPFLLGKRVFVYNGNKFFSVEIDNDKIGHRFGEFAVTRKNNILKKIKIQKQKKNK